METMLKRTDTFKLVIWSLAALTAALGGCAGSGQLAAPATAGQAPVAPATETSNLPLGTAIAELAMDLIGTRYRYGGTSPGEGFDCSGLVFYAYSQAGLTIPRTSQEQFRAARKIALGDAGAGDLIFFQDQEKLSHVGLYLGDGLFVHAPAAGQRVTVANIDLPYYQRHLVAVGRLLPNATTAQVAQARR
jgi:cell wall-associated NlpC family hydrolase